MHEEQERNFTYGGQFAVYNVTEYGFEPTGELDVRTRVASIAIGTERVDPKSMVETVRVKWSRNPSQFLHRSVTRRFQIDTSALGSNNVVGLDIQVNEAHGGFTTSAEGRYSVVEQGEEDTQALVKRVLEVRTVKMVKMVKVHKMTEVILKQQVTYHKQMPLETHFSVLGSMLLGPFG